MQLFALQLRAGHVPRCVPGDLRWAGHVSRGESGPGNWPYDARGRYGEFHEEEGGGVEEIRDG